MLMSLYWAFQLDAVARRNLYLDQVRDTETVEELTAAIRQFRAAHQSEIKLWQSLPM